MFQLLRFIAVLIVFCATALPAQFTFDDVDIGETTPLTLFSGDGLSAHLSTSTEFFIFEADPSVFAIVSGRALVSNDPELNTLDISFSRPVQAVSLLFALRGLPSDEMSLTAYLSGSTVGTASASGFMNDGFPFPEGAISFESSSLDRLVLSSSAPDFAIDLLNADVATTVIPEPSSAFLAAAGLALAGLISIRNRAN
jgi:hypothetical protein